MPKVDPKLVNLKPSSDTHESDAPENLTEPQAPIVKPSGFNLDKFKSKNAAALANVGTLQTALPHHSISQAKDFVRLHPNVETHWTSELCFVDVPIQGQSRDTLHLIDEEIALRYLGSDGLKRHGLVLASKPYDKFFLCHFPTWNIENTWNQSALDACERAKTQWTRASSRKAEGVDGYKITFAQDTDAFPAPVWPTQTLSDLIGITFTGRMIETADHPALRRLLGARQSST